jgi:plasmid stabilization system protein ParE
MDYRLFFTQRALNDLAEIIKRIGEDDAEAASRFGESLLDHIELLTRFPKMGNIVRKRSRVRKLVHTPIVAYYQVLDDKRAIEILHLRHGARTLPGL